MFPEGWSWWISLSADLKREADICGLEMKYEAINSMNCLEI